MSVVTRALVAALLAGPPAGAPAEAPRGLRVDPGVDGAVALVAAGGWAALAAAQGDLAATRCPCDRGDVNPLDRFAVDLDRAAAEDAADALAYVALFAAPALAAAAGEGAGDALLVLESVAVAGLLTQAAKVAFARPYPYLHSDRAHPAQARDGINYASFWSGHTATPMAAAVSLARVVEARHPRSPARWVAWTVGPALALGAGALQIAAGNHFPSDVVAGAAVGAAVGWFVPTW